MSEEEPDRGELMHPYEHPYRHFVPMIWRDGRAKQLALLGGGSVAVGVVLSVVGGSIGWLALAALPFSIAFALLLQITLEAALVVHRFSRAWDDRSELGDVRESRPHAADARHDVVHDEHAVTVEETGHLYIWRYRPLRVMDDAGDDEVLVPGRPRYAARVVEERPLDLDPAVAAEQLADAQAHAAALEAAAIERAQRRSVEHERRRELAAETSSTVEALKHLTGQRRD